MVAWWVPEGTVTVNSGSAVVEPLAWSGESAGSQAMIDIRVTVDVEASSSTQLFGESWGPGAATRCFRLEWEQYERRRGGPTSNVQMHRPLGDRPRLRARSSRPRIATASRRSSPATRRAEDVDRALRVAYPQEDIRIETTAADGGVVAAVGIAAERECVARLPRRGRCDHLSGHLLDLTRARRGRMLDGPVHEPAVLIAWTRSDGGGRGIRHQPRVSGVA